MKQGKTLNELAKELERQRLARKDFIADTAGLEVVTDSNGVTKVMMGFTDISGEFVISDIAHQQIATRLQIPFRYYQKMRLEYPELLDKNINSWFARTNEKRMLRTLDNRLRAFLSDRYRRLDNLELAEAVLAKDSLTPRILRRFRLSFAVTSDTSLRIGSNGAEF